MPQIQRQGFKCKWPLRCVKSERLTGGWRHGAGRMKTAKEACSDWWVVIMGIQDSHSHWAFHGWWRTRLSWWPPHRFRGTWRFSAKTPMTPKSPVHPAYTLEGSIVPGSLWMSLYGKAPVAAVRICHRSHVTRCWTGNVDGASSVSVTFLCLTIYE